MSKEAAKVPAIVVLGDMNVDIMGRVKAWPKPGDDCLARKLEMHVGGVGANCALGLAGWGVPVRMVGRVGRDVFGEHVLEVLDERAVDVRWAQRTGDALTGMFYINVTPDGERTFFGSRGANELIGMPQQLPALLRNASAAHLAGHSLLNSGPAQAAKQILELIHARGGWVSLDVGMEPSRAIPRKILQMAGRVDILLLSLDEAAALTGTREPLKASAQLRERGAREVVLKLGKRGCLVSDGGEPAVVPSFAVRAVDSTGAGDAFVAAFLQARLRGWPMIEGALVGNAAGALAATVVGAGENLPSARDVTALLQTQRLNARWDAVRLRVLARLRRGR
jgi:ribokinase